MLTSAADQWGLNQSPKLTSSDLEEQWGMLAGNLPVLLVRNVQSARRVVFRCLELAAGNSLMLPANSSHALVETVKHAGLAPKLMALTESLAPQSVSALWTMWQEMSLGLPVPLAQHLGTLVIDCATSVATCALPQGVAIGIFGCHLTSNEKEAGALLVFADMQQWQRAKALLQAQDCLTPIQELAAAQQVKRLQALIPAQLERLQQVADGIAQAAGLPQLMRSNHFALAHGVAVQIPLECDPATFVTYAKGENTPLQWLPEVVPIHPATSAQHLSSSQHLAHWVLVPVNPHYDEGLISQAVLGVVKAAEYLGVRWRTEPGRAAAYATLLDELYGLHHDAYRPVFATGVADYSLLTQMREVVQPALCRLS